MPKVSEAHLQSRRDQILAGARRAFARYGYEGATVARLEEETGLSRGAIFNYYRDKWALFLALAAEDQHVFIDLLSTTASTPSSARSPTRTPTGWRSTSSSRGGCEPTPS